MNTQKDSLFDSMINGEFLSCEEALRLAGDSHFYQKRTAFLLALQYLFVSFVFQFLMFFLIPPDFNCQSYDEKSFELYCSNEYLKSTCQTLFFTFSNCAILFFSFFSDLKGRKPVMILTYSVGAIALLIAAFAEDIYWFMVSITVAGVGINPYSSLSFILIYESSGQKFGQLSNVALLATFGLGQLIFIFISTEWRSYQVLMLYFIAIPIIIQIVSFRWIFESPEFLVVKKEFMQAKKVIQRIAKINGRALGEFTFVEEGKYEKEIKRRIKSKLDEIKASDDEREKDGNESFEKNGRASSTLIESKNKSQNDVVLFHKTPIFERQMLRVYTFLDLVKNKEHFVPMVVLSILYFCLYLTYYGALISTPVLGDIYYFNALAQSSAELFGYISANMFIGLLKRKLFIFHLILLIFIFPGLP